NRVAVSRSLFSLPLCEQYDHFIGLIKDIKLAPVLVDKSPVDILKKYSILRRMLRGSFDDLMRARIHLHGFDAPAAFGLFAGACGVNYDAIACTGVTDARVPQTLAHRAMGRFKPAVISIIDQHSDV